MSPLRVWILSLILLGFATASARALGADHPKGPITLNDKCPQGLSELVNRPERVHGYFVNWEDVYFYAGDTKALNEFLDGYAKLPNTVFRVVLHPGPKHARSPWDKADRDVPVDWQLYTSPITREELEAGKRAGKFHTRVDVYVGGRIQLEELKVPVAVPVESGGEIERFVTEHQKKQPPK
jgi:hypothetical protein